MVARDASEGAENGKQASAEDSDIKAEHMALVKLSSVPTEEEGPTPGGLLEMVRELYDTPFSVSKV